MFDNLSVSFQFLITILLFIIAVSNFFTSRKKNDSDDVAKDVANDVKVNLKLDEICRITNETRSDIKSMKNDIRDVQEEQIKQKMQIEALWKDVDALKNVK